MMFRLPTSLIATLFAAVIALPFSATAQTDHAIDQFGQPPTIKSGPLSSELETAIQVAFIESMLEGQWGDPQNISLHRITNSGDARVAWIVADLMRFASNAQLNQALANSAAALLGISPPRRNHWGVITDHLIAWDIPAPPNYLRVKREIFTSVVPQWEPLFVEGDIDWRHVSWGGVFIDNRPYDTTDDRCNCIPAADNPEVQSAEEAKWLKNRDIVFGIEVNGEYRAYPRQIMEVREMVNDTLGGRDLAIPYCTLCGAAQAYFTDDLPKGIKRPVLRTSGMLIRSNKVMYDITSYSVFDTFKGNAVTGPLAKKGITLNQANVITTTWGEWKKAHPETTVLIEELALGRNFDFRNGRDAGGPIFPVGDVDPRLPVHEDIIGVITASGQPIAFQRSKAVSALKRGKDITHENIRLVLDAGGVKAVNASGEPLGSHQAFWFAWSQFHPETELWNG
ncbi:MAG: DUF3179 domain-containing (seleno)protein [Pseudomonadota bacterium]|nr:DUF3179 domain-containing (seleno)protein [Pseudomonadota bacterium]